MRYFSLFTGIGGFELGIQQAYEARTGVPTNGDSRNTDGDEHEQKRSRRSPTCVGYSEIDKYAVQIYQSHFPTHKNYGDITKINADELPDFDLLCGGFPCQAFSVAGKRQGFDDTRGTLFFDICRLAKTKQPRLLLLENVKGLLNHDGGQTFRVILASLDELGYDCQWQVCNSKDFGVPQNRERVIIVGHLRGTPRPQVFPLEGSNGNDIAEITSAVPQAQRVYDERGISPTIDVGAGGNRQPKIIGFVKQNNVARAKTIANTIDANYYKGLDAHQARTGVASPTAIRRLTPTECERLQGFPDGWTAGVSDTQRYKTLGNAVTVNVIQAVATKLFL